MSDMLATLSEDELEVFVEAALAFFRINCREEVEIGEASISILELPILDYTGLIEVAGLERGFAYLTASHAAMSRVLYAMTGDTDSDSKDLYEDLIGEIVSTVVSNTRRHFGERLLVSVPKIFSKGKPLPKAETMGFILPLTFQREELLLVIALYPVK